MTKKPERRSVTVEVKCDTQRLYGPISDAIAYLQEIAANNPAEISLEEHWTGYEDMEMRFIYERPETDGEMTARIEGERRQAQMAAEQKQREAERQKRLDQYHKLRREFGP